MKTENKMTMDEAKQIQQQDLWTWKAILKPDAYRKLIEAVNNQIRLVIKHLEAGNPDLAVQLLKKMLLHSFMDLDTRKQIEKACDEADIGDPEKAVTLLEMLLPKRATKPREFHCWLWPDHNIGKRESRQLREEHNALVNLCGLLSDLARAVDAGDFPAIGQAMAALAPYRVSA